MFFYLFLIVYNLMKTIANLELFNCDIKYNENYLHLLNAMCYFRPSFTPPFPSFGFYTSGEMFGE